MSYFKKAASLLFSKRFLLVTNTFNYGLIMGAGDASIQWIEKRCNGNSDTNSIDWHRTGRLFLVGFSVGPTLHFWYKLLDARLPGANALSVAKKVLLDISIASTNILEGHSLNDAIRELRRKFLSVYSVDVTMWPAAQTINFYLLRPKYRVIYVAVVTYVYNMIISGIKHMEETAGGLVDFVKDCIVRPSKKK